MKILKGSPAYFNLTGGFSPDQPLYVMMNFETRCMYACPKCALPGRERVSGTPLTEIQRTNALALAAEAGVKALTVIGAGEPTDKLSYRLIRPVIEFADRLGLVTILFTTLYGLTGEIARFFRDHNVSLYISLDSIQTETYRRLTGGGRIDRIITHIQMLRRLYQTERVVDTTVTRLGINTTVVRQNLNELEQIRDFAGSDIHYVANYPIRRGKFAQSAIWAELVGANYEELMARAQAASETGAHTSVYDGVCSYFLRGISVDVDGQLLLCGYAGESARRLGRIQNIQTADDLRQHSRRLRETFAQFTHDLGRTSSCPLRDEAYLQLINRLGGEHD